MATFRGSRRRLVTWLAWLSIPCLTLTVSARSRAATDAGCAATPCATDDDCGGDSRCVPGVGTACASEGGATCGLCIVRWQTSCETDDDCGQGFACVTSRLTCDCSADAGPADGAVETPCADADVPQDCEAGGACVAAPLCDGGACLCWPVKACVEVQMACTVDAQCEEGESCIGGACVPTAWCEGGSCEPPCFGFDEDGGAIASLPDAAATVEPGYAQKSWPGCTLQAIGFGRAGDLAWSLLGLVAVSGARRLRRRR